MDKIRLLKQVHLSPHSSTPEGSSDFSRECLSLAMVRAESPIGINSDLASSSYKRWPSSTEQNTLPQAPLTAQLLQPASNQGLTHTVCGSGVGAGADHPLVRVAWLLFRGKVS